MLSQVSISTHFIAESVINIPGYLNYV